MKNFFRTLCFSTIVIAGFIVLSSENARADNMTDCISACGKWATAYGYSSIFSSEVILCRKKCDGYCESDCNNSFTDNESGKEQCIEDCKGAAAKAPANIPNCSSGKCPEEPADYYPITDSNLTKCEKGCEDYLGGLDGTNMYASCMKTCSEMDSSSSTSGKSNPSAPNSGVRSGSGIPLPTEFGLPDPSKGIKGIVTNLLNWLLIILGLVAIGAFIISGLQYFFSAGDERMSETAKRNLTYSLIGIIVALSGLVIVRAIDAALNAVSIVF